MEDSLSDTEKFYYAIRKMMGGDVMWYELDQMQQVHFIQALNVMIQITKMKK
jgi:hypothetical protein